MHIDKEKIIDFPDAKLVSTSGVERQNLTIRMECRRLTRLTNAFSKKAENLKAALDLHFTHYNLRPEPPLDPLHAGHGSRDRVVSPDRQGLGRDGRVSDLRRLKKAIRDLHGLEAQHVPSEPVCEDFHGETVWDGTVEVFAVRGHPTAREALAWSHEGDGGGRRFVAVLGVPLVTSARDAVRAAVVAELRQRRRG